MTIDLLRGYRYDQSLFLEIPQLLNYDVHHVHMHMHGFICIMALNRSTHSHPCIFIGPL